MPTCISDKLRKAPLSKIDVNKIVDEMRSLYAKDKKVQSIITTGDAIRLEYTENDVVPISQGHPLRDLIGLPGIPYNKIIQVAGAPDCGKSTWGAELIVCAQKADVQVIYWDSEDKMDANRLKSMGGKPQDILLIKTNEILKGAEIARKYILAVKKQSPNAKILFCWDSIGASQSRSHAERELDSEKHAQPGQDAKELGSVMKVLVALINKFPDSLAAYLINQTYAKIGFMQKGSAISGGTKVEYHSSFIVMLKRIKILTKVVKGVQTKYGIVTRATATKNHLTQGATSIHQLDFKVTADGSTKTESSEEEDVEQ